MEAKVLITNLILYTLVPAGCKPVSFTETDWSQKRIVKSPGESRAFEVTQRRFKQRNEYVPRLSPMH
jgi:hypothetical protein